MGLESTPTSLAMLPDGRLLVYSGTEIAIGDGVRWDVHASRVDPQIRLSSRVLVSGSGEIYVGLPGAMGRVRFSQRGTWDVEIMARVDSVDPSAKDVVLHPIAVGNNWAWSTAAGTFFSWKPGTPVSRIGIGEDAHHIVYVQGEPCYLRLTRPGLFRMRDGKALSEPLGGGETTDQLIAAFPFDESTVAVSASGLFWINEGRGWSQLPQAPKLPSSSIVSSAVRTGDGNFAYAVEGVGIYLMEKEGRVIQSLDKRSDGRIARATGIVAGFGGAVWVLLSDGVLQSEFGGRVSNYESWVPVGFTAAEPARVNGRLWVVSDGQLLQGQYDENDRLVGFEKTGNPADYHYALVEAGGLAIVSTSKGFFRLEGERWVPIAEGPLNGRIVATCNSGRDFAYVARDEAGWLKRRDNGHWVLERTRFPGLGEMNYTVGERPGVVWVEGRFGVPFRFDWNSGTPQLFRPAVEGILPAGWVQIFELDGSVRFLVSGKCFRFDPEAGRFVPDEDEETKHAWLRNAVGRPNRDARGNVWYSREGRVHKQSENGAIDRLRSGMVSYYFQADDTGMVWICPRKRLLRYDPDAPDAVPQRLRAIISSLVFAANGEVLIGPYGELPPVPYSHNTFSVQFMTVGARLGESVRFEFALNGGGKEWLKSGPSGEAWFNDLSPGNYELAVRAVADGQVGEETILKFRINPPWFLHPLAFMVYGAGALSLSAGIGIYFSRAQRREKAELERVVAERTRAVQEANQHLAKQVAETTEKSNALQASEERYRTLYDHNPAMFLTLDVTGRILSINQYGAEQLGYEVRELIGMRLAQLLQPEDREEAERCLRECTGSPGRLGSIQIRANRKNGKVVFIKSVIRAVAQLGEGLVLFVVCEDVTAQVQLEAQLRQAQKMEAVGQLAGGVAHDFNNLLTIIQGQAEWAESHAGSTEERLECIREIRRAADQAGKLTRQLLVFSRQQAMHAAAADLNDLVTRVAKLMQRVLGEDITLDLRLAREPALSRVDSAMIEQVLVNLALNARDAMPNGGKIEIAISTVLVDEERVRGRAGTRPGPHNCIRFTDTGCGIPQALAARIFEPFFTTKPPGQGTGLGLATSQSIVSQHHGWMEVQSEVGRGSTFLLFLPAEPAGPAGVGESSTHTLPALPMSQRVLLVEDEPAVRRVAQRMLERSGYIVIEAENADSALEAWDKAAGDIDILLTDLLMPGSMNGRALAELLSRRSPRLRVCLMSGHDPEVLARKAGQPGPMRPHLIKPFTRDSLIAAVSKSLPAA
ncbi:MAG: ATP-binding protein [Opitutaceae bacterium]|nr:ATP-binding protein [Opitutaceae bacterium]